MMEKVVEKAGEIIPQIVGVDLEARKELGDKLGEKVMFITPPFLPAAQVPCLPQE